METDVHTLNELQLLIKIEQENYRRAIEDMHDFEEAKKVYLKIKQLKKAIDALEASNYNSPFHSIGLFNYGAFMWIMLSNIIIIHH